MRYDFWRAWAATCLLLLFAGRAEAYIGPGSGISALGSLVSVLGTVFLVIVGFVWYPIKRVLALLRARKTNT